MRVDQNSLANRRGFLISLFSICAMLGTAAPLSIGQNVTMPMAPSAKTAVNVRSLGLAGNGITDDTAALQAAIASGKSDLYFPDGCYLLGTIRVPAQTQLRFSPRASVRTNVQRIVPFEIDADFPKTSKSLFVVEGDGVTFDGLQLDFSFGKDQTLGDQQLHCFIYARGVSNLRVTNAIAEKPERRELIPLEKRHRTGRYVGKLSQELVRVVECKDVVLENSRASSIAHMIYAVRCENVSVHGNRMVTGNTMTTFSTGSQWLRHHDNWSRDVTYQVVWRGGAPDPGRKEDMGVPSGSSTIVNRGSKLGDDGYSRHTVGVFDVMVKNNYAEYGNTLAWGNKGRQVVIDGNMARFISDYAFGSEGGENIVFSNNISINSTAGSFVSMYWGEKLLITGNTAIVRNEQDWSPEWSWFPDQRSYHGPFVRLHQGMSTPDDRKAGSKYGAGQVSITHNLFVNEVKGVPKGIYVQPGRDVFITGNKITNGYVTKGGPGRLTVSENEFTWTFVEAFPCVMVGRGMDDITISKNQMIRSPELSQVASNDDMSFKVPGIAHTPEPDAGIEPITPATQQVDGPKEGGAPRAPANAYSASRVAAISCSFAAPARLIVSDNLVDGWPEAVAAATFTKDNGATALVADNLLSGTIRFSGYYKPWKYKVNGNWDIGKFEPVEASQHQR